MYEQGHPRNLSSPYERRALRVCRAHVSGLSRLLRLCPRRGRTRSRNAPPARASTVTTQCPTPPNATRLSKHCFDSIGLLRLSCASARRDTHAERAARPGQRFAKPGPVFASPFCCARPSSPATARASSRLSFPSRLLLPPPSVPDRLPRRRPTLRHTKAHCSSPPLSASSPPGCTRSPVRNRTRSGSTNQRPKGRGG